VTASSDHSSDRSADRSQRELEAVLAAVPGTLIERLGVQFVEVSAQRLVATMPVAGNTQPYGLLHGGASVALAETLGSFGAMLSAGEGRIAVGVDINATHHRAARSGLVTAVATALQLGRTLASYEVVVTDDEQRRVCTARITCLLRDAVPGSTG
jgi:1,4-dihydroxy-2-naphthoyl-CoA hydrolase